MLRKVQCRKCREIIINNEKECEFLLSAHSETAMKTSDNEENCETLNDDNLLYLNEDFIPEWIRNLIEQEQWSKGKIHCKNCNCRIGSFDFISGLKCNCSKYVLPPVHLVKSKVDLVKCK